MTSKELDFLIKSKREEYKMIAEFMGYLYVPLNSENSKRHTAGWYRVSNLDKLHDKMFSQMYIGRKTDDLGFKYDWNSLMKVVTNIEKIENPKFGRFIVKIEDDGCLIQATNRSKENTYSKAYYSNDKLKSTYQSVILFVQWYNQNIKK